MRRTFWERRIERAFGERSLVWLSGVRRVGKTTLARSLPNADYFDCELLRVRRSLEDPELFFEGRDPGRLVILDEVHRLANPSEVLKIATDHFRRVRVLATGSSTLAAKRKFRDTLTGRKREVHLLPLIAQDLVDFRVRDLDQRMLRGGLPPFFLADRIDDHDFEEWMTSYWAKDLTELFVVEKRAAFMKFMELLFAQSGGLFEAQAFAAPCEVSRVTIQNYLDILETTLLAAVVRPFHGGRATEIRTQPKVYAFDTGFVCYFRGWDALRDEDRGQLLEHLVLAEIAARTSCSRIHYWRDKQQHEVDFILEVGRRKQIVAVECKSAASRFDASALRSFRRRYPKGENFVVTLHGKSAERRRWGEVEVTVVPYAAFGSILDELLETR